MTLRRPGRIVAVVLAAFALGACQPLLHAPVPTTPPPPGAVLSASSSSVARLGTLQVSATGCTEDFQFVEVRLVSGSGEARMSTAVASGWGGEPIPLVVPDWTPSGPATIEASCLEPNLSGASDGAEIEVFTYAPLNITIAPYPAREVPSGLLVPAVVTDGVLRVSGAGCDGRVLVRVARGPWLVASSVNFHYGSTLVNAAPDGTWSAEVPLRYSVASFSDPVAPGTMTAFAVCEGGLWYPAATFEVVGSAPAIQLVGPSTLYLSQCPEENNVGILGAVELAGGGSTFVARTQPGGGYGETFVNVPLPADAVAVTWYAGCSGQYDPWFRYQPAHWAA